MQKCLRISFWVFVNSEPLYGYLRTSISPRVFIEWSFFFRRNRRMSRIVLPASVTSEFSAKCSTLSGRFLCRHCKSSVVKLDWNGNAIVASISTTPLRQWRSSRLRFRRNSIQRLNRVRGTTIRLVYRLMILLSSFCHSGVKLSNKLFIVQCTSRDKNEGCWYPSS